MPYDDTVPATGSTPAQDYNAIRGNFAQVETSWNLNHLNLGTSGGDEGKHRFLNLLNQTVAGLGLPTTGANELGIYADTSGSDTELFVRQESSGSSFLLSKGTPTASSGEGSAYGGLQIRAGTGSVPAGTPGVQPISYSNPFSTATVVVVVSPLNANVIIQTNNATYTASGFSALANSGGGASFSYIAIGY